MRFNNIVVLMGMLVMSLFAYGGKTASYNVEIQFEEDGSGTAGGTMYAARTADNDIEHIGCRFSTYGPGLYGGESEDVIPTGYCQAADSNEVYSYCVTRDRDMIDAIKAITDFSYVSYNWDSDGQCTRIYISNSSLYLP